MGTCVRAVMFQPARLGGIVVAICMGVTRGDGDQAPWEHGRSQDDAGISGTRLAIPAHVPGGGHVGNRLVTCNGRRESPLVRLSWFQKEQKRRINAGKGQAE